MSNKQIVASLELIQLISCFNTIYSLNWRLSRLQHGIDTHEQSSIKILPCNHLYKITVKPPVATTSRKPKTSPQQPVFQNTKSFQVKSLSGTSFRAKSLKFSFVFNLCQSINQFSQSINLFLFFITKNLSLCWPADSKFDIFAVSHHFTKYCRNRTTRCCNIITFLVV